MGVRGEPRPGFPEEEPGHLIGRRAFIGTMASIVAVAGAVQMADYLDRSGEYIVVPPIEEHIDTTDTEYRVGSWNMHNETSVRISDLRKFAKQEELDVMMLQEVNRSDVQRLGQGFPNWGIAYVLADTKQELQWGGFGNAILTRGQKPQDVQTRSFVGKPVDDAISDSIMGAVVDLVNGDTSFARSKEGLEENRAAVAVTGQVFDGEDQRDVRLVTSHISHDETVHDDQLGATAEFIKDNSKDDRPTIFCGDLNGDPAEIRVTLSKIGGFITEQTGKTSANNSRTLDYCAYNEAGVLGLADVRVVYDFKTDHYPVVASWELSKSKPTL